MNRVTIITEKSLVTWQCGWVKIPFRGLRFHTVGSSGLSRCRRNVKNKVLHVVTFEVWGCHEYTCVDGAANRCCAVPFVVRFSRHKMGCYVTDNSVRLAWFVEPFRVNQHKAFSDNKNFSPATEKTTTKWTLLFWQPPYSMIMLQLAVHAELFFSQEC